MEDKEYSSDSEQSDEDYCPTKDKDAGGANEVSEDDSDGDPISDEDDANNKSQSRTKKSTKNQNKITSNDNKSQNETTEKDPTDDKAHVDALWADFLTGTDTAYTKKAANKTEKPDITPTTATAVDTKLTTAKIPATDKQIVTDRVEFAGETISIEKVIKINSGATETSTSSTVAGVQSPAIVKKFPSPALLKKTTTFGDGLKRPSTGSVGLSSVLGQIGKKTKIGVLEKTKLDWNSFKRNEGIDEQLQTHNKGKDGYLERQDFLERTDLRQFEIEKNLRQTNRKSNR